MLKNIVKTVKVLVVLVMVQLSCFKTMNMIEKSDSKNKSTVAVVCGFLIGVLGAEATKRIIRK